MEAILQFMADLSVEQWIVLATIAAVLLDKVFNALGWHKGAALVAELTKGLDAAKPWILKARSGNIGENIHKATIQAAARIDGVEADDLKELINKLATSKSVKSRGVKISLDDSGNLKVNAAGLVSKVGGKLSKFFKKVF